MTEKTFTAEEAKEICGQLGITWKDYDVEQFIIGMNVELEHGTVDSNTNVTDDDPLMTGKIALAHLNELLIIILVLRKWKKKARQPLRIKSDFYFFLILTGSSHVVQIGLLVIY